MTMLNNSNIYQPINLCVLKFKIQIIPKQPINDYVTGFKYTLCKSMAPRLEMFHNAK